MDPSHIESMNLCTTDAQPNKALQRFGHLQRATIDAGVLKQIEQELEEFEKVAIIFLLAAEYSSSYDTVLRILRNIKDSPYVIAEYTQNDLEVWGDKLLEALCIIGNHEILQNLGYPEPSELADRYHAHIPRCAIKINVAAKVLYKFFESLDSEKTNLLLQNISKDGQIAEQLQGTRYLEIHALYWLHKRYITISSDGTVDFSNLLKHLKQLDYCHRSIYDDVKHFCTPSIITQDAVESSSQAKPVPTEQHEPASNNDVKDEAEKISSRTLEKGLCVIINEVDFEHTYRTRDGSDADRENLRKTFSRRNFDIRIAENLTKNQIMQLIKEISDTFEEKKYDCLVVCILSHGNKGVIVTCDEEEISIKDMEDQICTSKLQNTIKLLIIQACQGKIIGHVSGKSDLATNGYRKSDFETDDSRKSDLLTDGPSENIERFHNYCQFMSTMERLASIRHKKLGSWFIEAVCQELSREEKISFSKWERCVNRNVKLRRGHVDGVKMASQLPEFTSRLDMKVYFPPYVQNEGTTEYLRRGE